ncbi:MAG: hypothetical protein VXW87_00825 [Pseudomonadota bacterium]|nr:hypothetical protein [Pseudomonadota bacterium]
MRSVGSVGKLSVSGSGNNCLYVAFATYLLRSIWNESVSPFQKAFILDAINRYLNTTLSEKTLFTRLGNSRQYADWSLILGVAIRQALQLDSETGEGEYASQAVRLCQKLKIEKLAVIEIQGNSSTTCFIERSHLSNQTLVSDGIQIHRTGTLFDLDSIEIQHQTASAWVKQQDALVLYLEGTGDDEASAHLHYGILLDAQDAKRYGMVQHPEDPQTLSSKSQPFITRKASHNRCNDPSFSWRSSEVKYALRISIEGRLSIWGKALISGCKKVWAWVLAVCATLFFPFIWLQQSFFSLARYTVRQFPKLKVPCNQLLNESPAVKIGTNKPTPSTHRRPATHRRPEVSP